MSRSKNTFFIHYGWITLAMGTLGVFGALGLARFGYTTVLPAMQADLGINNEQAGLLATFNLSGYLALSMLGGMLASKYGVRVIASIGLLIAGVSMVFTGQAQDLDSLIIWRTITGIGSGAANISIMGLWSAWFSKKRRGLASGIAVSGSSIALIFTGLFVPYVLESFGETAWRDVWSVYGYVTILLAVISFVILRNSARGMGLDLIGMDKQAMPGTQTNKKTKTEWKKVYLSPPVWILGVIYSTFGFSYIIYTTFFVKYLITDHTYTTTQAGNAFMLMGWFSLVSGLIWGIASDKIGRKKILIMLYLLNMTAFGLFAIGNSHFLLILSAMIYGLSAWSIPAIMAATCGDMLGLKLAPAALGFITLFFGVGQAFGPTVAGIITDASGSFQSAFLLAAVISLLGGVGSAVFIKKKQSQNSY